MTERERLIELLKVPIHPRIGADPAEVVADYLLDNGIICPPCKVGDKVFVLTQGGGFDVRWRVVCAPVTDIHINQYGKMSIRVDAGDNKIFGYYELSFVFNSEEEAEKALEERENNA